MNALDVLDQIPVEVKLWKDADGFWNLDLGHSAYHYRTLEQLALAVVRMAFVQVFVDA